MARALAWQVRGHRFDSGILHDVGFYTFIFPRSRIAEKEKVKLGAHVPRLARNLCKVFEVDPISTVST